MVDLLEAQNQYLTWHTYPDCDFDRLEARNVQFGEFHISPGARQEKVFDTFYTKMIELKLVDLLEAEN